MSASGNLLKDYELEREKRASSQYETTEKIKEAKAKTSLERSKNFVAVMRHFNLSFLKGMHEGHIKKGKEE